MKKHSEDMNNLGLSFPSSPTEAPSVNGKGKLRGNWLTQIHMENGMCVRN